MSSISGADLSLNREQNCKSENGDTLVIWLDRVGSQTFVHCSVVCAQIAQTFEFLVLVCAVSVQFVLTSALVQFKSYNAITISDEEFR